MVSGTLLPEPPLAPAEAATWVAAHLADLCGDEPVPSPRFRGGQTAASQALAAFDVAGYASRRNMVLPRGDRGASGLSPWIRHGLLTLPHVWRSVAAGPPRDVERFRDELLWQEYARHLYARLGAATAAPLRAAPATAATTVDPWEPGLPCVDGNVAELERDGWVVNQARMWLASHWSVRHGADWRTGESRFFRHLLDGSRAANRLGWQWTVGAATGRSYGFSRQQVERRAPGLCDRCPHRSACPIEHWPDAGDRPFLDASPRLRHDPDPGATAGPRHPEAGGPPPEAVWLTAESLGDHDPALAAHPELPAVFVFDAPLLARLRLSGKRLVFLAETLADLATRRPVDVWRGDPVAVLAGRPLAATFAPVPGWRRRADRLGVTVVHPWPWLRRPDGGSLRSFSAWRRRHG